MILKTVGSKKPEYAERVPCLECGGKKNFFAGINRVYWMLKDALKFLPVHLVNPVKIS